MMKKPHTDVADDLRAMLAGLMCLPTSGADFAECAESSSGTQSANCAHSAPKNAEPMATRPYARNDADVAAGIPVYRVGDDPLPATDSLYEAGSDCLILAYSTRLHVSDWLKLAGEAEADPHVVATVLTDLRAAIAMLEPTAPADGDMNLHTEPQAGLVWNDEERP